MRLKDYPTLVLFTIFILGVSIFDLMTPYRDFSEMENRVLASAPTFSIESVLEGEFTSDFETYVNDQFIGRDSWITLKSISESALQKIMNNNIVYGDDGYLFELTVSLDEQRYLNNIRYLNEFVEMYAHESVYVSLIPSSSTVLYDKVPTGFTGLNQFELAEQILADIDSSQIIDLFSPLIAKNDEYVYYKTDHHWTTLGAYYAYEALATKLGFIPVDISEYEQVIVPNFFGTYYSRVKNPSVMADELVYYPIDDVKMTILDETFDTLYSEAQFEAYDKYTAFINGNNGYTRIESGVNNDEKLLIIKDSYTNSLVPFLTAHYETIDLIDIRHMNLSIEALIEQEQYDEVLFLFSVGNFISEVNIPKIRY